MSRFAINMLVLFAGSEKGSTSIRQKQVAVKGKSHIDAAGRLITCISDEELIDCVIGVDKDDKEIIIDTEWMQVTGEGFNYLKPDSLIMDMTSYKWFQGWSKAHPQNYLRSDY
ncbi:hypothetical protein RND81_14G141300 [Saponaria officinalis]|uniref:BRCT domain-containing protein n=1 Tax=Saponaria officinalis TaxID=3572 RepID=A0AAW1GXT8_SAPOF